MAHVAPGLTNCFDFDRYFCFFRIQRDARCVIGLNSHVKFL